MPHAKTRKAADKLHRRSADAGHKKQKEAIDAMLRGVDALIVMAENAHMGTATRIFYTAKEDLVHWAVTMKFHESMQDRFINRCLYDNRLSIMESLVMRAINGAETRGEIIDILESRAPK